jgi:hypothetical protein
MPNTQAVVHKGKVKMQLVLIVTGTVTDVPQTSPHLASGVIIVYVIDNTALLQQE